MDPFIGEIRLFPFNFAPKNWALCNGQLLPIQQFSALFSIIGVTYGGNGINNFQLPNLQGRVVAGVGTGPGLSTWDWGEENGEDSVALTINEIPAHNHLINAYNNPGTGNAPSATNFLAKDTRGGGITNYMAAAANANVQMSPVIIGLTGSNAPHENRQPFLALNYCIALQGVFPARN
jgi:microcystin-dependent protein